MNDAPANSRQVSGSHYKKMPLEHWDIVSLLELDYFQGQVTRYVLRWRDKGGIVDLEKARHVMDKYIEVEKARAAGTLTVGILHDALTRALRQANELEEQHDHKDSLHDGEPPSHLRPVT
jgi:hypothetical protein